MGTLSDFHEDIESVALRLVADYRESLMAEAVQLCGDHAAAEDLVFRTLEVLFRGERPGGPDRGAPMIAWLRGVMRRIHRDSRRGMARTSVVYLDPETLELVSDANAETGTTEGGGDATADPAAAVQARDDAEKVREAVDSLPPRMREIIVLRYFESVPIARMAAVLRISQDAVKCRLYYARKVLAQRLRTCLGNRGVKALLLALALAALTAIGAAVVTAVGGGARNTPPALFEGTPLSEGGGTDEEPPSERGVAQSAGGSTAIANGCSMVQLFKPNFGQETIERAKAAGLRCNVFWADDPEEARRFLDMGIDTILTNDYQPIAAATGLK